jgi:hypothetical protein
LEKGMGVVLEDLSQRYQMALNSTKKLTEAVV